MYQHESAINIRMFPSLLNFPPPPSPPQCSRLSQITGVSSLSHRADTHWHLFLYTAAYMYPCFSPLLSRSSAGKESACNAGDTGLIPGSGRSPGEGKGYPLQFSGLENSKDCIVHGVIKSQTRLSEFHFHILLLPLCPQVWISIPLQMNRIIETDVSQKDRTRTGY